MNAQSTPQPGLRPWQQGFIFLVACAICVSRRPDAVFHPQFWAEDGHAWFADAYNFGGWAALFRTQDGYFQVFPRLAASLALLVPFALAPLVLNIVAILVQALPVTLILSPRSSVWGSLRLRALLAAVYLVLPNSREINAIVTNSQWVLALCVILVLAASGKRSIASLFCDFAILLLSGLTGPFCVFLFPVALSLAWRRRDHIPFLQAGALAGCCLIQAWGLLIVNPSGRSHYAAALGANPILVARILAGHIYLGALLGGNVLAAFSNLPMIICLVCVAITGTAIVAICFARSGIEIKLFLAFSALIFAVSLVSPNTGSPTGASAWDLLSKGPAIRYWFFPTLAFTWSLLWSLQSKSSTLKKASAILLVVMCFGIVRDWRIPAFKDAHFAEEARRFESAPPGTEITIAENPPGWTVHLVKH